MEKFVYIGFIMASGTLKDGKPWSGYRVPVGYFGRDGKVVGVKVLKAPCTDDMYAVLSGIQPGTFINAVFDSVGRAVEIRPAD